MTNLLEKSLILGFGIFTLAIFFSLVLPFLNQFSEFNRNKTAYLDSYLCFISKIDQAVKIVKENPEKEYIMEVDYPNDINITINDNHIIYRFIIKNEIYNKILVYNISFYKKNYYNIPPKLYLLNVSSSSSLIIISFLNLD